MKGVNNVGGLVGWDVGKWNRRSVIKNSYATGNVRGEESVGGLVGDSWGTD